jgi:hypothetical protein
MNLIFSILYIAAVWGLFIGGYALYEYGKKKGAEEERERRGNY